MVTEGADSLSLAAVCCVMPREGQTKQLHPALGGCFVLVFLARAIVGIVGVGKEAQVSLRVHKLPTREACAWLTVRARIG